MLRSLFAWLDSHPSAYWCIAVPPTALFLGWLAGGVRRTEKLSTTRTEIVFVLAVLAVLLAWRWPFLLSAEEYNPDESQLIAGALTLRVDPMPWRSLDSATSGPLNFYPLVVPGLLGAPQDYFTARCVGLLLVWGALVACYRLFRSWCDAEGARIAILPALAFFSTTTDADFIHYSSEHLPLLLTGLSAWFLLREDATSPPDDRWRLAGSLIAGMLPWTKLQACPLAVALLLVALRPGLATELLPLRPTLLRWQLPRVLAAAIPSLIFLLLVAAAGQFEHFYRSYILQSFAYVGDGSSLAGTLARFGQATAVTRHYPYFFFLCVLFGGLGLAFVRRPLVNPLRRSYGSELGLVLAAMLCILVPRRPFTHYLLLSVIPLAIWYGRNVARRWKALSPQRRPYLALGLVLLGGLVPFWLRSTQPVPEIFGSFSVHWREPRTALAEIVRGYASPRARLAIWGWLPSLYVETGLPQATRDGNTAFAIMASPQREYYQRRFLADLRETRPILFVDAVGPGSEFFPDRLKAGHEIYPALNAYIAAHYDNVSDVSFARVYLRRSDAEAENSSAHLSTPAPVPRLIDSLPVEQITPSNLPQWRLRSGMAQMLHPPAEIVWSLDPTTRAIEVEYGFAPEAYRQGRSDGAELIFELRSEGAPIRHLFHRFLDPARRPGDRGKLRTQLTLPPFKPGARLVVRTTAGIAGNSAWDWIYLSRITPVLSPSFAAAQFPHFNRVPDAAEAELAYLLKEQNEDYIILHAPASLDYILQGGEKHVHFEYGFRPGAYNQGGHTDGATFRVELRRAGQPAMSLFEKHLDPASRLEDRERQTADLPLPSQIVGARLIFRIEPGPSNAWDWTYLTDFKLE